MNLLLRRQALQAQIDGREPLSSDPDDYAVLDDGRKVGRIVREKLPSGMMWVWFLQTAPVAPPPNNGICDTLDEAKAEFRARYERYLAGRQ